MRNFLDFLICLDTLSARLNISSFCGCGVAALILSLISLKDNDLAMASAINSFRADSSLREAIALALVYSIFPCRSGSRISWGSLSKGRRLLSLK